MKLTGRRSALIAGKQALYLIAFLLLPTCASAKTPWDLKRLSRPPQVYPATSPQEKDMRALFFAGPRWQGKPTRVFAWYGEPARKGPGKFPAIILVHGGLGTAFAEWVKLWNDRGYAAIALDTCGSMPSRGFDEPRGVKERPRHAFAGPPCWDASFDQTQWPVEDQWTYHAVADIILANSLLRSLPHVDPQRIGITGVSWGGYLTTIAASVDSRFRFSIPVYGCGFRGDNPEWPPLAAKIGAPNAQRWLDLWDPSVYLGQAKVPFLWVDGSNDFFCPLNQLQKSYRLPKVPATLSIRVRMTHSQDQGQAPDEIQAFADRIVKEAVPLASIVSQGQRAQNVWTKYRCVRPIVRADLIYTLDTGPWQARVWSTASAELDSAKRMVWAVAPSGTTTYYFNIFDDRGLMVSSTLRTLP
jgi:dienelactone hydrolase